MTAFAGFCVDMFHMSVIMSCVRRVVMSCVRRVVVAELACGECCDKDGQADEHADSSPSVVSLAFAVNVSAVVAFVLLMALMVVTMLASVAMHLEAFAVGLDSAVFMVMLVARFCVSLVVYLVSDDTYNDGYDKKHSEEHHCLLGNHGQHDERLVA